MKGIKIIISPPIWGGTSQGQSIFINEAIAGYSHDLAANGLYEYANSILFLGLSNAQEFFENRLGHDFLAYNGRGTLIFKGFINKITLKYGTFVTSIGPLLDVANYVTCRYNKVDYSVSPPVGGTTNVLNYGTDNESIEKYGTMQTILSLGNTTQGTAEQYRDIYLKDNARPPRSSSISIGSRYEPRITIDVSGYHHLMKKYVYNDGSIGSASLSVKVRSVIGADPEARFSTDYTFVESNTGIWPIYANNESDAFSQMKAIAAVGEFTNQNRFVWGAQASEFKAEEKPLVFYKQIPTELQYLHKIQDAKQRIFDAQQDNREIPISEVLPGQWMRIDDFSPGLSTRLNTDLRDDPRNLFVETVKYNAQNDTLSMAAGQVNSVPQLLARYGLYGIG